MPDDPPEAYDYRVTAVSTGCTRYAIDQTIVQFFTGDPPASVTLHYAAPCTDVTAVLVDE